MICDILPRFPEVAYTVFISINTGDFTTELFGGPDFNLAGGLEVNGLAWNSDYSVDKNAGNKNYREKMVGENGGKFRKVLFKVSGKMTENLLICFGKKNSKKVKIWLLFCCCFFVYKIHPRVDYISYSRLFVCGFWGRRCTGQKYRGNVV